MEKKIDYPNLYTLQDKILQIINALDNGFYLTGGTALHRFYYNARYSDDLDFFVNNSKTFNEDVKEILDTFESKEIFYSTQVASRDFYRVFVFNTLQLDFVNDRVYRYKKSIILNDILLDNKVNILTNKINAIVNRDEEKDVFDLMCLAYNEDFYWREILEIANKKQLIEKDIFLKRLSSFPLDWLRRIKQIKDMKIVQKDIEILCEDILKERNNSLKRLSS
jgi:hypothetical protein